ncbi:MAG: protein kinase, partial [Pseudomonadota bacterium]
MIEQGLATEEEVQHALEQAKSIRDEDSGSSRSVAQLLVDNGYATKRQIHRLKSVIEAERSGQAIPGFRVLGKLGAGAMATVYKAKQVSLDRMVAIKVLPRKFNDNTQFIERFYAEGRAAAALDHPNIVQVFDFGEADGTLFLAMELVEGTNVNRLLR